LDDDESRDDKRVIEIALMRWRQARFILVKLSSLLFYFYHNTRLAL
jgi:hypothetical protein